MNNFASGIKKITVFMFDKTVKVSLFSLGLLFLSLQISARDVKNDGQKNTSAIGHKSVELVQSDKNIDLTTHNGKSVSLPKVEKIFVDHPSSIINNKTLADAAGISFTSARLTEKLIEEKEMKEISKELGINIRDNEYLDLYREIIHWIGTPYRYGAMSTRAVDCSGFTGLIFKAVFNENLPRASAEMSNKFKAVVAKDKLEPGNLVFFSTRGRKRINHVGIYIGENKFIHASRSKGVTVSSLNDPYYARSWKRGAKVDLLD